MIPIETRKRQLADRLAELQARAVRIDAELDRGHDPMPSEAAIEREGDEVLEDLGSAALTEIRMIEAAFDRIARGSYGICAACGDPIAEERLDAVPHAPKCRTCAA